MPFVRVKRSERRAYAYLVENRWDESKGGPRQRVIAYLGPLGGLGPTALPPEHRTPALLAEMERLSGPARDRADRLAVRLARDLRGALVAGREPRAAQLLRRAERELGAFELFGRVVPECMHEVGAEWEAGRLSVSEEHLATQLLARLLQRRGRPPRRLAPTAPTVILCVPEGEEHTMPLLVAESLLRHKGFRPINIGGTAPEEEIRSFVVHRPPHGVLISVTRASRYPAARRLASALRRDLPSLRVAIGGQGVPRAARARAPDDPEISPGSLPQFLADWDADIAARSARAPRPIAEVR